MKTELTANTPRIVPVLLAGGSGTRLWPLSRADRPKQFISFGGQPSLFHQTIKRLLGERNPLGISRMVVVGSSRHAGLIEKEVTAFPGVTFDVLYEPCARNTAPAIAAALHHVKQMAGEDCLAVLPCDHHVEPAEKFRDDLAFAAGLANGGAIITLGITPKGPHTGYGYIQAATDGDRAGAIAQFIEKPEAEKAAQLIAQGDCYWNAGMFVMNSRTGLEEFGRHAPQIAQCAKTALSTARREADGLLLDADAFAACESLPFDIAVMEKTAKAQMVAASFGWSDLGEWPAIAQHFGSPGSQLITADAANIHLESGGRLVAVAGVDDLIIVDTPDALLVTSSKPGADVKAIVNKLKETRPSLLDKSPSPPASGEGK